MAYVNEVIPDQDRKSFDLDYSDKWLFLAVPSRDWTIDRETGTFVRLLRLYGRKNEPGDPDARHERDFHFHWEGRDFIVFARAAIQLEDFDGRQFGGLLSLQEGERVFAYRVWAIWEALGNGFNRRFGIECRTEEFFEELRNALLERICPSVSSGDSCQEFKRGRVVLKVSERVESV